MLNKVVVFDGECVLCNKALMLLIKLDKHSGLRYTSLQGEYVKNLDMPIDIDSIVFYEEGSLYYKSTAILKIVRSLGGVGILANIFYLIPRFVRDFVYDMIAKYRYNIFGKMDICYIASKDEMALFLD